MSKVFIVLEDGHIFEGKSFGAEKEAVGELVFTTGAGSYTETLTDPNYYGQVIIQTFPLIGNYGVSKEIYDNTKSFASGYIVREWCKAPSNFTCAYDLDEYLKAKGIPGVYGVDTRELTRIIRDNGVMNVAITSNPDSVNLDKIKAYKVTNALEAVNQNESADCPAEKSEFDVTVLNYGTMGNIVADLNAIGCNVKTVPYNATAETILAGNPDGIVLSDGPGNPDEAVDEIAEIKKFIGTLPVFGIGLGHQLAALSLGGKTFKLTYGHRSVNQPIKCLLNNKMFILSQNHGYAVDTDSLQAENSFVNGNDGSCEGLINEDKKLFTTQFRPEACSDARDKKYILDKFTQMMRGENNAAE